MSWGWTMVHLAWRQLQPQLTNPKGPPSSLRYRHPARESTGNELLNSPEGMNLLGARDGWMEEREREDSPPPLFWFDNTILKGMRPSSIPRWNKPLEAKDTFPSSLYTVYLSSVPHLSLPQSPYGVNRCDV